ncbi:MAG: 1-(5-phosphoribosyl)-5-[(5-phosphoribosylamino)methylideneamino]imidazole-4-carboxamide isomerase [Ruminococcaceae bacterium]|nr:1-(5-phosphoribosyl)-5-[(5-phosphoribosylamino)methylideneamino]imidazole-4-carboxamide isomerase [Oscillospiraceae bacterium]
MILFPAIDLYEGKAVRLYKGDYAQMTVYSENPVAVAEDFARAGATHIHVVDLEGAKSGETPNIDTVSALAKIPGLFLEVGGGIRSMEVVDRYLAAGVSRVILGTAAVKDESFLKAALAKHGDKIAVGVDIKDGMVAIKGWIEKSEYDAMDFCAKMEALGVKTIICTDISKDGAMKGANHELYRAMAKRFGVQIIASGGVSSIEDVQKLAALNLYGAIIGKAYYTGAIDLKEAIFRASGKDGVTA